MSGNLKQIFEYELHRKLSLRAKTTTSEMNLLISSFKFYYIDETGFITRENWPKVFGRIGLSGFSEYDFNELFDMFDPNKTGIINYKNFTQYMYDLGPYQPFQENSNVNNMSNNINMNNLNMKNNIFIHNNNKVQSFNNSLIVAFSILISSFFIVLTKTRKKSFRTASYKHSIDEISSIVLNIFIYLFLIYLLNFLFLFNLKKNNF